MEAGCERCIELLNYGGLGHTMAIHSTDRHVIMQFGLHKPAYRICVNTPAAHGSVGLTTGVPPSMTLGCGTPGGNITSDNITPLHLINIKRLAFETRSIDQIRYPSAEKTTPDPVGSRGLGPGVAGRDTDAASIRGAVRSAVANYLGQRKNRSDLRRLTAEEVQSEVPLPTGSVEPELPLGPAVDFVCEDDVKRALEDRSRIVVNAQTIITPAAQDMAEEKNVFVWESGD